MSDRPGRLAGPALSAVRRLPQRPGLRWPAVSLAAATTVAAAALPGARVAAPGLLALTCVAAATLLPRRWAWPPVVATVAAVAVLPLPVRHAPDVQWLLGGLLAAAAATGAVQLLVRRADDAAAALRRQQAAGADGARSAREAAEQLSRQVDFWSSHDALTRLMTRRAFVAELDRVLAAGGPVGVLQLSLAGFTYINETLGPAEGDEILSVVASRLDRAARESDSVARLGGDEFAVLLCGLRAQDADHVGARLLRAFEDPIVVGNQAVPVRVRAGLAIAEENADSREAHELIRRAESTARLSQPGGPIRLYAGVASDAARERFLAEADLARAVEADEFYLLYQPLYSTTTGRISSVEALVRWRHPERGVVPPDSFVGLAEQTGLIVPLGLRVLELACSQLRRWTLSGHAGLRMAVNMSARQLVEPGVVESVREVLWRSGVDPRDIVLELTESLLVEDDESAVATLWQLRALGVRLALDDFGTGYSSLARLGDLPIDEMKIDKSFTDRLGAERNDSAGIVTAAVAMGHGLGLEVVTEGVETTAQAAFLTGIGCDLLQGYLLGKPMPAEEVAPLFSRQLPLGCSAPTTAVPLPRPAQAIDALSLQPHSAESA